jgi:hypothetical protein
MSVNSEYPLRLVVETANVITGQIEGRKVIDHNNREDRVWLGKHCFWAFRNGRSVKTFAEGRDA